MRQQDAAPHQFAPSTLKLTVPTAVAPLSSAMVGRWGQALFSVACDAVTEGDEKRLMK